MPKLLPRWLVRCWPIATVLVVGYAITGWLTTSLMREAAELDGKRFSLRLEELKDQLDGRVELTEFLLHDLRDHLEQGGDRRKRVLESWLKRRGPEYNLSWLHGIVIATNVHDSRWQTNWDKLPARFESADWLRLGDLARNRVIEFRADVRSHAPRGGKYLDNYDLKAVYTDKTELGEALRQLRLRMSEPRTVMRSAEGKPLSGTMFYMPVHGPAINDLVAQLRPDQVASQHHSRWLNVNAVILGLVDYEALSQSIWGGREPDIGVELFSSTNQTAETCLNPPPGGPRAGAADFRPYFSRNVRWRMYGRDYSIFLYTLPLFESQSPRRLAWTILAAGVTLTCVSAVFLTVSLQARLRLERKNAELRAAHASLTAAEQERIRLGYDLHDGAIQSLYAIQLGLTQTSKRVASALPELARGLSQTRERVDEVIAELRKFILARESGGDTPCPLRLDEVLTSLTKRMMAASRTRVGLRMDPAAAKQLNPDQAVQLAQIVRGALANCLRHANASRMDVELRESTRDLILELSDNGVGFNVQAVSSRAAGLESMRRRATELGATMTVQSQPGRGTRVTVTLPLSRNSYPAVAPAPTNHA